MDPQNTAAAKIEPLRECSRPTRRARGHFAAMASAYFLGVFNDNFFKQAACLIAVAASKRDLQGLIFVIYTVPFLLFAAPAGWAADRFAKRRVAVAAKGLEVAAALCGVIGIFQGIWPLIIVMVFLVGFQETFFSPAISGAIPETFPRDYVLKANSMLKVVTTVALIGMPVAGEILGLTGTLGGLPMGYAVIGIVILATAVLGLVVSLWIPHRPAAASKAAFPWRGPLVTLGVLARTRRDPLLMITIAVDAFIWFIALLQVLVINWMGIREFSFSDPQTGRLVLAELVGTAVGGALAEKFTSGPRWHRVLAPGILLMSGIMFLVYLAPLAGRESLWYVLAALFLLLGAVAGVLMVPLEAFVQVRPAATEKGAVLAAGNFATYFGMLLAGGASIPLELLSGTTCFLVMGAFLLAGGLALWWILRRGQWTGEISPESKP